MNTFDDGTVAGWRKSSHSGATGNCVEITRLDSRTTGVRNSRNPDGPFLRFPGEAVRLFLAELRAGGFAPPRTPTAIPRQPRMINRVIHGMAEQLADLTARGFEFSDTRDARGNVVVITGIRLHHNVKDVVQLFGEQDADAVRVPGGEPDIVFPRTVLWRVTGSPAAVLKSLLSLADPNRPGQSARTRITATA